MAPIAARNGATVTIRMPDIDPNFPSVDLQPFRTRLEAESGSVTDGRVIAEDPENFFANHRSGDRYVVFLVNPDSALELRVAAPASGRYDLTVGYSNGTGAPSSQGLAVNGAPARTLDYPSTRFWGLIGTVTVPVELRAGENTVRFSHASGIADLDFVDVASR